MKTCIYNRNEISYPGDPHKTELHTPTSQSQLLLYVFSFEIKEKGEISFF